MSFNGTEGTVVTLNDASGWTANFRATISSGDIIAHFVGKQKINAILEQEGCMGIRIYYGIDDDGEKNLILVGVAADENDMVNGVIVEKLVTCPPKCSTTNALNS